MGGLITLLILIAAGLLVFIIIYNKNKKNQFDTTAPTEPIAAPPSPAPAVSAPPVPEPTQPYFSIYTFDESRLLSHCPVCDGEIPIGSQLCQICGHKMNY